MGFRTFKKLKEAEKKTTGKLQVVITKDRPIVKHIKRGNYRIPAMDLNLICHLYMLGQTDEEVAFVIGLEIHMLWRLKAAAPEIQEAINIGKDITNERVKTALFKRAVGIDYEEVTKEPVYLLDPIHGKIVKSKELVVTKTVSKYLPPDVTAGALWLRNRCGEEWKDWKNPIQMNQITNVTQNNKVAPEEVTDEHKRTVEDNFRKLRKYGIIDADSVEKDPQLVH